MKDILSIQKQTHTICKEVADDPQKRINLRLNFYKKYGVEHKNDLGFGAAEIAFTKWEVKSRVKAKDSIPQGSKWWSEVNLTFIYYSTLADLAYSAKIPKKELPVPSQKWIDFFENPTPQTWYCAHNCSVLQGYLEHEELALEESQFEQAFINMVLYRVLFAQAMVEGEPWAFKNLGKLMANPKNHSVSIITHLHTFYPIEYPITQHFWDNHYKHVHGITGVASEVLDDLLIKPELQKLYKQASKWNEVPQILNWIEDHLPAYPKGRKQEMIHSSLWVKILATFRH